MNVLFLILLNVILPVFVLIGAGAFLHRKFQLDMNTLSKLNNFLLMPAVSFVNIYQSHMGGGILLQIFGFLSLQAACLIIASTIIAKIAKFDQSLSAVFKNSVVLNNSANFGLPVSQLVFHNNTLGLSIQVIVIIFQNLLTYTYGLMNSVSVHAKSAKGALREFLKIPVIYALLLGLILHAASIEIPLFLWTPIANIASAFIAIALITLGAQVRI